MWEAKVTQPCLFVTPWTIQSMEFFRTECWSGQPFPSPGNLPNPRIEPRFPALQADSIPAEPQGKPKYGDRGEIYIAKYPLKSNKDYYVCVIESLCCRSEINTL